MSLHFPSSRLPSGSLVLAAAVAALDLASNAWARAHLAPTGHDQRDLSFAWVRNHGAALGIGSDRPVLVGIVEVLGILSVGWWLRSASNSGQRACVALVLGGAAGNLLDRLQHGAVTDWVHVAPYPPYFNLADVAIRGGILAVIVLAARNHHRNSERTRSAIKPDR